MGHSGVFKGDYVMSIRKSEAETKKIDGRRGFLRMALTTGTAVAVVAVVPTAMAGARDGDGTGNAARQRKKGYHLTPHIIDYYKSVSL